MDSVYFTINLESSDFNLWQNIVLISELIIVIIILLSLVNMWYGLNKKVLFSSTVRWKSGRQDCQIVVKNIIVFNIDLRIPFCFSCNADNCNRTFFTLSNLNAHRRKHQRKIEDIKCNICGKVYDVPCRLVPYIFITA